MPAAFESNLIETIPPSEEVRRRLGETLREADLLRKLLRLSERAEKEKARRRDEVSA